MCRSTSTRKETGPDGKSKRIKTLSYHRERCNRFVRADDQEEVRHA